MHARRILEALDQRLNGRVDLTLYGRAALALGFPNAPAEIGLSRDVDAVLSLGQAEELLRRTNFWEALEDVNKLFEAEGLFMSHLFEETQVVLSPDWRECRVPIEGPWRNLDLCRLGNLDLLLSKLMRDDPVDRSDAQFIIKSASLERKDIERAIQQARIPEVSEVADEFRNNVLWIRSVLPPES
jgi:hypothetical protein